MQMRWRITLRSLMILVAIVAVISGVEMTWKRWALYRTNAAAYANQEAVALEVARRQEDACARMWRDAEDVRGLSKRDRDNQEAQALLVRTAESFMQGASIQAERARLSRQRAVYYGRLKDKYKRAAARPWQAVEPDPPE
jgi:hypothetical protein